MAIPPKNTTEGRAKHLAAVQARQDLQNDTSPADTLPKLRARVALLEKVAGITPAG